jgi:hypothetical protein
MGSEEEMTQALPKPVTDDPLSCWPPKAHIVRKKDLPAKEGTIALCGAKLMGMDLKGDVQKATCDKCLKIMRKELDN